jgi:hypothetical protein
LSFPAEDHPRLKFTSAIRGKARETSSGHERHTLQSRYPVDGRRSRLRQAANKLATTNRLKRRPHHCPAGADPFTSADAIGAAHRQTVVKSGDQWFLDIPAEDVKTKRPLDYLLSRELSRRIDVYVTQIRSQTPGANAHDYLWASSRGRPFRDRVIYNAVRRRTRKALGFPVNLRQFRRGAATFWLVQDPANVRGVKNLLGHASFATTEKYYIMSQSRLAGRVLARAVDAFI